MELWATTFIRSLDLIVLLWHKLDVPDLVHNIKGLLIAVGFFVIDNSEMETKHTLDWIGKAPHLQMRCVAPTSAVCGTQKHLDRGHSDQVGTARHMLVSTAPA